MAFLTTGSSFDLPPNLRVLVVPVVATFVLIILSFFVMREAINRITLTRLRLEKTRKDARVLQQKQLFLQEITDQAQVQSEAATLALPERNSALLTMAQLRNLAEKNIVSLENMATGSQEKSEGEVTAVVISFDAIGRLERVLEFLSSIQGAAPLARLDNVKMTQQTQDSTIVTASLKAYWAPFPEQIPALTEPVQQLTAEEQEILTQLLALTPPPFFATTRVPTIPTLDQTQPQAPTQRANPFTF